MNIMRQSLDPSIEIIWDVPQNLPLVRVDRNQLELALLNLVLNARDAMSEGGRFTVVARQGDAADKPPELAEGDYVLLAVTDTGCGMDEDTLKRCTEPFFTTKDIGKGSGLGLSMVHGLAARSGGTLNIHSIPGTGTRFELWLPTSAELPDGGNAQIEGRGYAIPSSRILLVDDDPLVRATTAATLREVGHSVVEAGTAECALKSLRGGLPVDLVITDHAMPGMTGASLAARIHLEWSDLPVILASGYADLSDEEAPNASRLTKPYSLDDLLDQISRLLRHRPIYPYGKRADDGRDDFRTFNAARFRG